MVLEIVVDPAELRRRISLRTAWMFTHGLVEETRALRDAGAREALGALRAIGYDEAMEMIEGRLDRSMAEARVNLRTARLAKRQRTWFRHQGEGLRLEATGSDPELLERAAIGRASCRERVFRTV